MTSRSGLLRIDLLWTTVLDPRCCSLKYLSQNETEVARNKLIKEVINVSSEEAEVITVDEEGHGSKRNTIKGFNIFDSPEKKMSSSATTADNTEAEKKLLRQKSANQEVENYLDLGAIKVPSDVIPMDWWKVHKHQFPRIAKLARKWLCVTATSTPSERVFSDCGLALTAKRSRLKGNVLRDQVMIRRNARYLSITEDDIRAQFLKMK